MTTWKHRDKPSEYYLGAILRAYDQATLDGKELTPANLWNYVAMECLRFLNGFHTMFAWDKRKSVNRVKDIMEVVNAGLVPGLRIQQDGHKVLIVSQGEQ